MSLKKDLIKQIKGLDGSMFTYKDLKQFCSIRGCKESTAEKRMRESRDEIESIFSPKKAIIGYVYKKPQMRLF